MANKKVSAFTEITEVGNDDLIHVIQNGNSRKIKAENLFNSSVVLEGIVIAGFVKANTTAGDHAILLPLASQNNTKMYIVKADDLDAGVVKVQVNGADKIDVTETEIVINTPKGVVMFYSDGTGWWII